MSNSRIATTGSVVVTIVIVGWNSRTLLAPCLESVRRAAARLQIQVIVVDNASADGTADYVAREFPEVTLIRSGSNLGFGKGCNLARPHALGEYILFLNPDTELPAATAPCMVDFLKNHPDVGAVGCKMVFPDGTVADQNLQWFPTPMTEFVTHAFLTDGLVRAMKGILPWNDPGISARVTKLFGGCVMVGAPVLEKVGWFDDRFFMYAEDVDLSRRIREAGWKLYYLSEAEVVHAYGGATKKAGSEFSILMMCQSMSQLIGKYQGPLAARFYQLAVLAASAMRLICFAPLLLVASLVQSSRSEGYRARVRQYSLRLQWALGLRCAFVP